MPLITSDEIVDYLVPKLQRSGFQIEPETVTCAELLEILKQTDFVPSQPNPATQQPTDSEETRREGWCWFGRAGHLIVAEWCRFHLCTLVGDYLVSTVGEYWPERDSREIHAQVHDPAWLTNNRHRKGDDFDHAYMLRFGFKDIGYGRKYEVMVFKAGKRCDSADCGCGLPEIDGRELDATGYNNAGDAARGHYEMCMKYSKEHQ